MKPKATLRSFLAIIGSSVLAISYSHGQTVLADSYLTSLDVPSPTTLSVTPNFPSFLVGPLTGSSDLTITGYFSSASVSAITNPLSLVNNTGNTFSGNIIIDGSALRIAGNPFATSGGGFVAGSMTSSDTITINRAGTLHMDDNVSGGYTADRFGSGGSRPAVNLAGGTINLNGLNNASSSVQTFGALTSSSGQGTLAVFVNGTPSTIRPTLTFSSLAISSGSLLTFNGTNLGTGTNDARITFTSAPTSPTLTNGILAGARFYSGAAGTSEFVTYGANGVRSFTASDYTVYGAMDINGATSTQNVQMTGAFAPVALTADTTVNSLNYNGNAGAWSLGGFKLTIASGMFLRNGNNSSPSITTGTLTAGTGSPIDLNIIIAQHTGPSISAVIADNGASGVVTLVKSGDARGLTLNGSANNTYTGGTSVVGGTLSTGNTGGITYLGTGKATVDGASALTLGAIGATSNSTGADYTAQNGGQINIATAAYTSSDTFDIKANSVISGGVGSGTGLNSLDRTTNITLATNSVIGHNTALTGALNLSTGTIKNLGTSADLYYGLTTDHTSAAGQITIGTGTAFKGISSVSSGAKTWTLGTINVATGTTDVYFQGLPAATAAPTQIVIGNGATAGSGAILSLADTGTLNVNILGSVQVSDTDAVFGNTSTGRNVKFVVTEGSTLTIGQATGMGSGNGIATATVKNGGTLAINNAAAINGAVTIETGGMFTQNMAALTGTGTFTHTNGSILNLTNPTSVSGATQALGAVAGTIVRMGANPNSGATSGGMTDFDARLNDAAIYQLTTGITFTAAALATDSLLTLNSSGGIGGILTNNLATQSTAAATGRITIGSNGATMAATTNTTLTLGEDSILNGNLTLGSTAIIDGASKLGAVTVSGAIDLGAATRTISAVAGTGTLTLSGIISNGGLTKEGAGTVVISGNNSYAGTTTVNAGTLTVSGGTAINNNGLVSIANVAGATFQLSANETIGNLSGGGLTGGTVNLQTFTLALGADDFNQTFAGIITGTGAGGLTKQGTGTFTLTGSANNYTGITSANGGVLKLENATALPGGIAAAGGTSNLRLLGGVVGLTAASGNFLRAPGTGVTQVQWTGSGGFAAYGGDRTVNLGGTVNWNAGSFVPTGSGLVLSAADSDGTLVWASGISFAGVQRTIQVNNGSAAVDARISGVLSGGGGLNKTGAGTLELTNSSNSYTGTTTVSDGTLRLGASDVLSAPNITIAAATLDVGAGFTDTVGNLDVSAAATINLGDSSSKLVFADSNGVDWTGGTLNITGAFVSGSSIKFATSGGLIGTQLSSITLNGSPTSFSLDGSGFLISGGGPVGYAAWQAANGTAGTRDQDHDNDGVDNGTEYFIYGPVANSGFTPLPGVTNTLGTLSVTWTKAAGYTGTYPADFVVETSDTLVGAWTPEIASPNPGFTVTFPSATEVKYTFPNPLGTKKFARLKVTGP